jgi:uncharacterized membrane protein YagU involved in acid resistance
MTKSTSNKTVTLIWLSLLTGTLDISSAFLINYQTSPLLIFRFIASGVFGKAAFSGTTEMIWWGILFHYAIATAFTVCLFIVYPAIKKLVHNKYMIALICGLSIWLFMNFFILPIANEPKHPFRAYEVVTGIIALIICIGLPVSLVADRYYKNVAQN